MSQMVPLNQVLEAMDSHAFRVLATTDRSQVAVMVLGPRGASSARLNRHHHEDQLLWVVEGQVVAETDEKRQTMEPGDLIILPAGTPHRFINVTERLAKTVSIYTPPAY